MEGIIKMGIRQMWCTIINKARDINMCSLPHRRKVLIIRKRSRVLMESHIRLLIQLNNTTSRIIKLKEIIVKISLLKMYNNYKLMEIRIYLHNIRDRMVVMCMLKMQLQVICIVKALVPNQLKELFSTHKVNSTLTWVRHQPRESPLINIKDLWAIQEITLQVQS